ncbi:Membrane protein actII-3 [Planctomycetales bacterium 10988]|nr:Membrane protein actII-3 [Planctomycetales bacterium 10988]
MFNRLGKWVSHGWWLVILGWIALSIGLYLVAPPWEDVVQDGDLAYLPKHMTSLRAKHLIEEAFPGPTPLINASDIEHWPLFFATFLDDQEALKKLQERVDDKDSPTPLDEKAAQLRKTFVSAWKAKASDEAKQLAHDAVTRNLTQEETETVLSALNSLLKSREQAKEVPQSVLGNQASMISLRQSVQSPQASLRQVQLVNRVALETAFPQQLLAVPRSLPQSQLVVILCRENEILKPEDFEVAQKFAMEIGTENQQGLPVVSQWTYQTPTIGERMISKDGRAVLIVSGLSTEFRAARNEYVLKTVVERLDELSKQPNWPKGLETGVSGSAAIGGDMMAASAESIRNTELATVTLVLLILLVVYRAPMLVIVPLTTIGFSVFVAMRTVSILADQPWIDFQVFTTSKIFIIVILFGAGTDFCLFLISRYKEELGHTASQADAMVQALGGVGHALAASAFTTIGGLGVMYFATFGKYQYSGPTVGLCLAVALAACLTLAPALIRAFGKWVFWPFKAPQPKTVPSSGDSQVLSAEPKDGLWHKFTHWILVRPVMALLLGMAVLLPWAFAGFQVDVTHDLLSELEAHRPSKEGTSLLHEHFSAGDMGPITVVAYDKSKNFASKEGRKAIETLSRDLLALHEMKMEDGKEVRHGVKEVRSYAAPLGDLDSRPNLFSPAGRRKMALLKHPRTRERYVDPEGVVTQMDVVLSSGPFALESLVWLDRIDERIQQEIHNPDSYWYGTEVDYTGTAPGIRDLKAVTDYDRSLIQPLVVMAVLMILFVLLREPVVCCYLMLSVLFSYFVTMGVTDLLFAWLYGASYEGLDWKLPVFVFVILVAVGMDYNIYLITRVVEEQDKRGAIEGIREAVHYTGGIITSCGVIMAGTFCSMMTGTLRGMQELGFALCFGVLIDTFIVRTVLVPSFLSVYYGSILPRVRSYWDQFRHVPAMPGEEATAESAKTWRRSMSKQPHSLKGSNSAQNLPKSSS